LPSLRLPSTLAEVSPVWHLFVVGHPERDRLQAHLADAGISSLIHYPIPPHLQQAYLDLSTPALPIAEQLAGEVLSLPIGPHLKSDDVDRVIEAVRRF